MFTCVLCFFSSRRRHTRYIGDWSSDVCSSDLNLEYLELRVLVGKPALVMRVAEESDRCGGVQETVKGLRRCEDVFVFILKRAVDQNHAVRRKRSGGQRR